MAGWTTLEELVSREFQQALEEGKSAAAVAELRSGFEGTHDADALRALHAQLVALPIDPAFAFDEPDDLPAIRALRQGPLQFTPPALDDALFDRLHGAWLGRCGGCALGNPVELIGLCPPAATRQHTWRDIKRYLTAIDPAEWPIRDFIPQHSPAAPEMTRLIAPKSTREYIDHMESDDDIRYTVLGQLVMADKGAAFRTEDVADKWLHVDARGQQVSEPRTFPALVHWWASVLRWPRCAPCLSRSVPQRAIRYRCRKRYRQHQHGDSSALVTSIGQDAAEWAFQLQRGPGIEAYPRVQHRRRAPKALPTISRRRGRPKSPTAANVSCSGPATCISDPEPTYASSR